MKGRSHRLASTEPPDDWVNGSWTVDCVCGVTFDDGEEMVNCDECGVWVHTRCSRFVKGDTSFACDKCKSKKNRNDNEETEVAQLLVELTTKTMRMDNLCRPSVPPRPAYRLWKDVPIEEKVHVQGVPGGDPALFQGLSSVFTSELWKCTGYVPKKFNFQYREFPCWDEKEEVDARAEEGIENPVDRGADVLFSLSKEIVSAKPAEMEVSLRGSLEQADCERKSSPKEMKKREGNDPSVKFVQNDGRKERNNLLTLAVHSCKQKEELLRSKERNGKKKSRSADKEADSKRRASTPSVVEKKLEFHDDEGFKVGETGLQNEVRIVQEHDGGCLDVGVNGDKLKDELAVKVSPSKYFPDEASRHKFPFEMVGKSEKANHRTPARSDASPGSSNGVPTLMVSNDAGGSLTEDVNLAVDGLKHLKDENHDQKDRDLHGNASSVLVDSQKLDPPVRDLHTAVPEVLVNHMLVDSNGGVSLNSIQHNTKVKTQVDDEQPRGDLDLLSSVSDIKLDSPRHLDPCTVKAALTHPSKKLHVLDPAGSNLPSGDDRTQDGNSEAVGHCDRSDTVEGVISSSGEPPQHEQELERSAEMLSAQKGSLEPKHDSNYVEEPSGTGGVNPSPQAPPGQRKVIVGTGKSPTTSGIVISKSSVSGSCKNPGTITSPLTPRSISSTKQRVKMNSLADTKKDHAMETGKDDPRHEELGKMAKEPLKTYASSGLKASQTNRISQASTSKRTMSDPKEQVIYPSSKASVTHNVAVSLGSGESAGSLQTQSSSHVQNKVTASGFSQKGERHNQSSCQPPSKVNHSPSMHPPAPVNSSATLSDEELALLLHQELNSSPRVPRVPRVRHAGTVPQLGSSTTTSLLIKRSSSSGAKDQILVSRRKKEDAPRNGSRNPSEFIDESKKKERMSSYSDQRRQDPVCTTDGSSKNEASNGSPDLVASSKKNVLFASTSTTGGGQLSSIGANDRSLSSIRNSPRDMSDDDVGANVEPIPRTLPGLLDEIMSKGKRMTYEELCNAVLPHWHNLRKHNGERYAYSSHSQAVLDCLRNRNEWAQLVDRGPKTNAGRKRRKLDSDLPVVDSVGNEYDKRNLKEVEVKYVESQREDFPKGKRKARKRRRLALQGRGIKDVRKRRKADAMDSDLGGFSQSSEGAESIFSEDESQASTNSDETGPMK